MSLVLLTIFLIIKAYIPLTDSLEHKKPRHNLFDMHIWGYSIYVLDPKWREKKYDGHLVLVHFSL